MVAVRWVTVTRDVVLTRHTHAVSLTAIAVARAEVKTRDGVVEANQDAVNGSHVATDSRASSTDNHRRILPATVRPEDECLLPMVPTGTGRNHRALPAAVAVAVAAAMIAPGNRVATIPEELPLHTLEVRPLRPPLPMAVAAAMTAPGNRAATIPEELPLYTLEVRLLRLPPLMPEALSRTALSTRMIALPTHVLGVIIAATRNKPHPRHNRNGKSILLRVTSIN